MKQLVIFLTIFSILNCSSHTLKPISEPLKFSKNKTTKSPLKLFLNEKKWSELFPNRFGINNKNGKKNPT